MQKIEALELSIKKYIETLLVEPTLQEQPQDSEEILLPPNIIEEKTAMDIYEYGHESYIGNYADLESYNYNVRRLGKPDGIIKDLSGSRHDLPSHLSWIVSLQKLSTFEYIPPDPIIESLVRLKYLFSCQLKSHLEKLISLIGMKTTQAVLHRTPERFLNLLEIIIIYQGIDNELIATALHILGARNVKRIFLKSIDNFQKDILWYLQPLLEIPGIAYVAEYSGEEFLAEYRKAITKDISGGRVIEIRNFSSNIIAKLRILTELGLEGRKLIDYVGSECFKQYFMKDPGITVATELIKLGIPIWEDILKDHIRIEDFKTLLKENPLQLSALLAGLFRITNSTVVIKLLGREQIAALFRSSDKATLQLSAIGLLVGMRSLRCDDPELIKKFSIGALELLGLGARFKLVIESIKLIANELPQENNAQNILSPEEWTRSVLNLLQVLQRLEGAGCYPRPELAIPILQKPKEYDHIIGSYRKLHNALIDIERFEPKDLLSFQALSEIVIPIAFPLVEKYIGRQCPFSIFKSVIEAAFRIVSKGGEVPPIPSFAHEFSVDIKEAFFQKNKNLNLKSIGELKTELLALGGGEDALLSYWQHTFELCRAAGFRFPQDLKGHFTELLNTFNLKQLSQAGFTMLLKCLLNRYNCLISEALVRLLLGHVLYLNPQLRAILIQDQDIPLLVNALYELFFDRVQDENNEMISSFRKVFLEWLSKNNLSEEHVIYKEIERASSLEDLYNLFQGKSGGLINLNAEDKKIIMHFKKVYPLCNELFSKYRILIQRECAKLRPVASGKTIKIIVRPSRSYINLLSGVYGEDCSVSPLYAQRLFHLKHTFYQILLDGSDILQGYLSVLKVRRGLETALKFDVINPSNNINLDAEDFLKKLLNEFSEQAKNGGIDYIGISEDWVKISNRSSLIHAAQILFHHCPIEQGFSLEPAAQCFQTLKGGLRVIWKKEKVFPNFPA